MRVMAGYLGSATVMLLLQTAKHMPRMEQLFTPLLSNF